MKPLHLSKWHMSALCNELKLLYDSHYSIVPLLQNVGVKIFSQWSQRTATFNFADKDHVVVTLSSNMSAVDKHLLTTAIIRVFKWDEMKHRSFCCGLVRFKYTNELHFAL